jgi:hypothetical protein
MKEIWKPIWGFTGYYEISNLGRVRSLDRFIGYLPYGGRYIKKGIHLKLKPSKDDYVRVSLFKDKKEHGRLVHRLVGKAFKPNPSKKSQINHKNGIKWDNRAVNLEWATKLENQRHAIATGLQCHLGEKGPGAKLSEQQVVEMLKLYSTGEYTERELAKKYGVTISCINNVRGGRTWGFMTKNLGHEWREAKNNLKLKESQVKKVMKKYKSGVPQFIIAKDMNIGRAAVNKIVLGMTYKNWTKA